MRIVTFSVTDGDEVRIFQVVQAVDGGFVMEGDIPACLCCIDKRTARLVEAAVKFLGLSYLLWSNGWVDHYSLKQGRWSPETRHVFVSGVKTPDNHWIVGLEGTRKAFREGERVLLKG